MTNEEIEKTIQFILEQQAQFYVDLKALEDKQTRLVGVQEKHQQQLDQLTNAVMGLTAITGKLAEKYSELVDAQKKLAESQEYTDNRLNVVIDILMKHNPPSENSSDNAE